MLLPNEGAERLQTLDNPPEPVTVEAPEIEEIPPTVFYVDQPKYPFRGELYCHLMTSGTKAELIQFGRGIGLKPEWIQHADRDTYHFDLNPAKRLRAIRAGAISAAGIVAFRATVQVRRDRKRRQEIAQGIEPPPVRNQTANIQRDAEPPDMYGENKLNV